MAVTVRLPGTLRDAVGGATRIQATGTTLQEVFADIDRRHPGFHAIVLDPGGAIRSYLSVFVDDADARTAGGLQAVIPDGSEIMVIPAMSGGH
jgi:molybdopterin synthase sulfur carrier subunit